MIQGIFKIALRLKKTEVRLFLLESTMIENATFPHKSPLSKTNVKTNSIRSTKWTYHQETGFYFFENLIRV